MKPLMIVAAAGLAITANANAQNARNFVGAPISGANLSPVVDTCASGFIMLKVRNGQLVYKLNLEDISGLVAADLRFGTPDRPGPIIANLFEVSPSSAFLTDDDSDDDSDDDDDDSDDDSDDDDDDSDDDSDDDDDDSDDDSDDDDDDSDDDSDDDDDDSDDDSDDDDDDSDDDSDDDDDDSDDDSDDDDDDDSDDDDDDSDGDDDGEFDDEDFDGDDDLDAFDDDAYAAGAIQRTRIARPAGVTYANGRAFDGSVNGLIRLIEEGRVYVSVATVFNPRGEVAAQIRVEGADGPNPNLRNTGLCGDDDLDDDAVFGDLNGDGIVDEDDLRILLDNFTPVGQDDDDDEDDEAPNRRGRRGMVRYGR